MHHNYTSCVIPSSAITLTATGIVLTFKIMIENTNMAFNEIHRRIIEINLQK